MSDAALDRRHEFGAFDSMSTEELEAILRMDSYGGENGKYDTDAILYILEVIDKRQNETAEEKKERTERALEEFKTWYLPSAQEGSFLYYTEEKEPDRAERPARRLLRRAALIAAVLAGIFALMLTAQAAGIDIFGAIARWSDETFSFAVSNASYKGNGGGWLAACRQELEDAGLPAEYLPTWLPDGYTPGELEIFQLQTFTEIYLPVKKSNGMSITVSISVFTNFSSLEKHLLQKNVGDIEQHTINGHIIYLFNNYDTLKGTCTDGNIMVAVSGSLSPSDIIKVFNSIEGLQ